MPIRIAQVVEATVGGVARHVIDLVTHLDPAEFSCVLYCSFQRPDSWKERMRALQGEGIVIRELNMTYPNPIAIRQLKHWVQRDEVDLLHMHSAKAGWLGRRAAREMGLPAVYTPHAFPFQRTTDLLRPLYRQIEQRMAQYTAKIICVSAGEYAAGVAAGLPPEKMVVIPNGIDIAQWPVPAPKDRYTIRREFGIADEEVVVGALGRLVKQKGYDLLLEAADDFLADFPRARLIIWGNGPQRNALKRLALRLGLERVSFLGNTADPWRAYAAMDIFCAPSRWEAGPYAVLEAMAVGLPVVASPVAGHTDYIVHETTGLLVPIDYPGPLAGALRPLLADSDVRHAYGTAGHHRVEHEFTLEQMVNRTAAVYKDVIRRKG